MPKQKMAAKKVKINNPLGLHARPAALVVQQASGFKAETFLSREGVARVNGKSVMGVMTLAAEQGSEITIEAEGEDAEEAVEVLAKLLQSNFEEQA